MASRRDPKRGRDRTPKVTGDVTASRSIWDTIAERGKKIPVREQDRLPRDFARRFDEYVERAADSK